MQISSQWMQVSEKLHLLTSLYAAHKTVVPSA
jgi:hypothetical protein